MNFNLHTPINPTSYGKVGYNFAKEFKSVCNLKIHLIGQYQHFNDLVDNICIDEYDYKAPVLKIWHQFDLKTRIACEKYFAMPIFETKLCKTSIAHCNAVDHLIVNSEWAANIIKSQTRHKDVSVCELGVDTNVFKPNPVNQYKKTYTFLHIGKKERRKNQDFIIKAFNAAFTKDDNVELLLCWHNPFLNDEENNWYNSLLNCPLRNKIKVVGPYETDGQIKDLINYSDCGIFPSRAEGWLMPGLEMMACNKPIIVSNYSGQTQYCNKDNSFLIDIDKMESSYDPRWPQFNGFEWAKFEDSQLDQCVEHMRYVYNNRPENKLGLETANRLSWKNCTKKLWTIIKNK